jgi:hypothetical protein
MRLAFLRINPLLQGAKLLRPLSWWPRPFKSFYHLVSHWPFCFFFPSVELITRIAIFVMRIYTISNAQPIVKRLLIAVTTISNLYLFVIVCTALGLFIRTSCRYFITSTRPILYSHSYGRVRPPAANVPRQCDLDVWSDVLYPSVYFPARSSLSETDCNATV